MFTITRITAAVAVIAVAIVAGTSLAGPPAPKADTVTLTLANPEPKDRPTSRIAERFARNVATLSNGSLKIRIAYEPTTASTTARVEAALLRGVRKGSVDLAIVPTRAFEASGIRSFRALQAPFLITTETRAAAVTTGPIAARLQSGLQRIGLTGLGLAPEGLRRPFGFKKPLIRPADFKGARIRAISSNATHDLIRALGATPFDLNGGAFDLAIRRGEIDGAEASFARHPAGYPAVFTAGNIAFFAKVDAFVANTDKLSELPLAHRKILRLAAAAARATTLITESERKDASRFCERGGTIVVAPASALKALRSRTAVLTRALERDPETRASMAAISRTAAGAAPRIDACEPKESGPLQPLPTVTALVPAGAYRKTVAYEDMVKAGDQNALVNSGVQTLTTTKGKQFVLSMKGERPEQNWSCPGTARLRNGLAEYTLDGSPDCGGTFAIAWVLAGDTLTVTRTWPNDAAVRVLFGGKWKRIS